MDRDLKNKGLELARINGISETKKVETTTMIEKPKTGLDYVIFCFLG